MRVVWCLQWRVCAASMGQVVKTERVCAAAMVLRWLW